ncbi:RES domain-containing protein [Rhodovulum sp. BSW8]|uniref:RES domain-containing protein n=1 Tax=Rhodovulum visakhapatnamense TaxID=364297 RepID=A0A4R8FCF5_9RHOB|nr:MULTISPECIES: RES family NAD+ phosphorylase [Rhodovulum]RBO55140.1 RES domain-containing protein [Rhodovulum sp. BSW8]TDX23376.1 RES domain-containing protein [Rhodovulum visakhapatnamense]
MIAFKGIVWRILPAERAAAPCAPVQSPEGRFHHSGQAVLYASLTPEGAGVAIARYLGPGAAARMIQPLSVSAERLVDLRALPDPTRASVVWQDIRALGSPSPTWAFSDAARARNAQGMLYPSRSRPELTHLVLFDPAPPLVAPAGEARPWPERMPELSTEP